MSLWGYPRGSAPRHPIGRRLYRNEGLSCRSYLPAHATSNIRACSGALQITTEEGRHDPEAY